MLVDDDVDDHMAVQSHADPVAHDTVHRADLHRAIKIGPPRLDILGHLGPLAGQVDHHAVNRNETGPAHLFRQPRVFAQVAVFAVHRDDNLRIHELVQLHKIGPVGMARDVIAPAFVVVDLDAQFGKLVHDADDAALVAGDGLR